MFLLYSLLENIAIAIYSNRVNKREIKYLDRLNPSSFNNKTIVITGGNSGIGFEAAKDALYLNMKVILACRNIEKAEKAIKSLKEQFPKGEILFLQLDLADFHSIRIFANQIQKLDVDVFYNNAGLFLEKEKKTIDGFNETLQVNYLGQIYLNELLIDYFKSLKHKVHILFTSSLILKFAKIDYSNIEMIQSYKPYTMYCNTKRMILQYGYYMKKNLQNTNIDISIIHPGATYTPLIYKSYKEPIQSLAKVFMNLFFHKPWKAALTSMFAIDKKVLFIGPRGLFQLSGYPKEHKILTKYIKRYETTISITKQYINTINETINSDK